MKRTHQLRGEDHANAKLTESKVRLIRASDKTAKELAKKYGMTPQAIYNVKQKRTWKHVKGNKNVTR